MVRSVFFQAQRGQAMIEALIASALVLVPLFLAIPVIAKYMDIRSSTVQAARYAAWERTVWYGGDAAGTDAAGTEDSGFFSSGNKWNANEKKDNKISAEIGTRLLSDNIQAFSNNDTYGASPKQFWNDRHGSDDAATSSLLQPYDGSVSIANGSAPGVINKLLGPLVNIMSVVSDFTLDTKAKYTAQVNFNVQQVAYNTGAGLGGCTPDANDPLACQGVQDFIATGTKMSFSEKNVLVANGWGAYGPGSADDYAHPAQGVEKMTVYNQTRGLAPVSWLKTGGVIGGLSHALGAVLGAIFPELNTLDLGRIEVDKVPADRLKP
jgi:hypothetical protein